LSDKPYSRFENKRGRPAKWALRTKSVRLPEQYIEDLVQIAREWEEVYLKSLSL
jgi:hypothetical protein